jgi:hypothetical protein
MRQFLARFPNSFQKSTCRLLPIFPDSVLSRFFHCDHRILPSLCCQTFQHVLSSVAVQLLILSKCDSPPPHRLDHSAHDALASVHSVLALSSPAPQGNGGSLEPHVQVQALQSARRRDHRLNSMFSQVRSCLKLKLMRFLSPLALQVQFGHWQGPLVVSRFKFLKDCARSPRARSLGLQAHALSLALQVHTC